MLSTTYNLVEVEGEALVRGCHLPGSFVSGWTEMSAYPCLLWPVKS